MIILNIYNIYIYNNIFNYALLTNARCDRTWHIRVLEGF